MGHPLPRAILALALGGLLAWSAGFVWFVQNTWRSPEPPARADGIVALTGGADRVETAFRLLAEGRARVLLVSGTGAGADLPALAHRAGLDSAPLEGRVTLGHKAATTHGNATETAEWVRENDIRSLIVVTAAYHMPRALTELSRALPDVTLYPHPVTPPALSGSGRFHEVRVVRLMAAEYTKWLVARAGLSSLEPVSEQDDGTRQSAPARPDGQKPSDALAPDSSLPIGTHAG